ncbi:MAG: putative sulfate/molybdate transporter [Nitrososphaerota archaeon]|nr:putative sulfate/molybdate transporter [Candidatus Bathyarchaeota archaeon]MCX8162461.1 putative sulfate/molybdate transporter [Candidatus Bathyarchaeota archaeon]MDW8062166.1 putative sulfate/molybdate transporter [Nitrososphaerota archaeon]
MVKVKGLEFSLREFSGSLGDFGPINPFILGYIVVLRLNPTSIFLAMGITNIALGLIYRLPLPVEPKKAIATAALSERWKPQYVYISGLITGIVWLILSLSGLVDLLARITPTPVIRGVQFGLALILIRESLNSIVADIPLALSCIALIAILSKFRIVPSALAVFCLGVILALRSSIADGRLEFSTGFQPPTIYLPSISDITFRIATVVFSQILLTFSNAILATHLAIKEKFPENRLREKDLALNMGALNIFSSLIGGAPMCHGAGGFASQYFFGARTGGAMVMEGIFELVLALLFAKPLIGIFAEYPLAVVGVMILFASIELCKPVVDLRGFELIFVVSVGLISMLYDLAIGYLFGLAVFYISRGITHKKA